MPPLLNADTFRRGCSLISLVSSMFAKLIANAMNSANKQHIHNCYVDFIKQMSSLEAIILSKLSSSKTHAIA